MKDIIHESEGRFLSHIELSEKFDLQVTFLEALQIRQSNPYRWRALLTAQGQTPQTEGLYLTVLGGQPVDIVTTSPVALYSSLIKTLSKIIKVQAKWSSAFQGLGCVAPQKGIRTTYTR